MWKHSNAWRVIAWIIHLLSLLFISCAVIVSAIIYYENDLPYYEGYMIGKETSQTLIGTFFILVLLSFVSWIYLIISAGHKKGKSEICLNRYDRIPTELFLLIVSTVLIVAVSISYQIIRYGGIFSFYYMRISDWMEVVLVVLLLLGQYCLLLLLFMRFVRRRKAGITYWNTSMIRIVMKKMSTLYYARAEVGRVLILFIGGIIGVFFSFLFVASTGLFSILGVLGIFFIPILVFWRFIQEAIWRDRIYRGIDAIIEGNPGHKINTEGMKSNEKKAGNQINHIGEGLERAIEEATKNERLKAELITNVSHDIKTPLTSIINYVDLIKRENIDNEKIKEYVKVLDEKSQRLKHLTEDLVEASKANTGNLTLDMEKIDFMQLIHQTLGEFQDKFEERKLQIVLKLDKSPVWIYADGRRVWRVMENLLQNVYKYAMPQTRVYIESVTTLKKTTVTIKNISENPLNIPASQLTERFIRGDVARTTEGSGLGLSIAKSLMELMDGELELYLDGDLFRASVGFKRMDVDIPLEEVQKPEAVFDWEAFMRKSNQEQNEEPQKQSDSKSSGEGGSSKSQKITLVSMWKQLGNEAKHLGKEIKKFHWKE